MLLVSGGYAVVRPLIEQRPDVFGTLMVPAQGNKLTEIGRWAADNGSYTGFEADKFVAMLKRHRWGRERCLFVAAPDVIKTEVRAGKRVVLRGDHNGTLELFDVWGPRLSADGWPVAFVAQDGCDVAGVPWRSIQAVFIGGSNAFKLGPQAAHIVAHANIKGKWAHMGRVNGPKRIQYAAAIGCDSVDGSGYSAFSREMLHKRNHARLFRDLSAQRRLVLEEIGHTYESDQE